MRPPLPSEDRKLVRIVLVKSERDAGNCWQSLLEGQYETDAWVFNEMEKKMTLERFQREVCEHDAIPMLCVQGLHS